MSNALDLLMLWLLLAVAIAMLALAVRARGVELREGLPTSRRRVVALAVIGAAVATMVVGATASTLVAAGTAKAAPPSRPADPPDSPASIRRKELEAKVAGVRKELDRLLDEIDSLNPPDATPAAPRPRAAFDLLPLAHFLVPILVILATFFLVFLGDPSSLIRPGLFDAAPDRDPDAKARAMTELDTMARLADKALYREGLDQAVAIEVGMLDRFDRLDWAFLKSYCAVQLAGEMGPDEAGRGELLGTAAGDLATVLEQAPNRGEAVYLLALTRGLLGKPQESFDGFDQARALMPDQGKTLPFDHNESVCLLNLAEESLGRGDAEGAGRHFDQVTRRGVLVDQIPTSLVKIRLLNARQSLQAGDLDGASAGIAVVRKLEGLGAEQEATVDAICDAMETLIAVRGGDEAGVLRGIDSFLGKHLPAGLPEPDEEIADEYLESPVGAADLRLPPQVFRAFFFLRAEALAKAAPRRGTAPTEVEVAAIARPLFRALQFELRQRDVLATLGGLYLWFVPDKRAKALQWLEAAASMGVEGRIVRRLIEQSRALERENREAMDWFRSTSLRFLHDPTVSAHVRQALIEEMGRFQEFRPLLLDLEASPELEPREPTLRLLRDRAGYLEAMVADLAARKSGNVGPHLHELREDYQKLIAGLDASAAQMSDIERRLVQEVGKMVIT